MYTFRQKTLVLESNSNVSSRCCEGGKVRLPDFSSLVGVIVFGGVVEELDRSWRGLKRDYESKVRSCELGSDSLQGGGSRDWTSKSLPRREQVYQRKKGGRTL